MKKNNEPRVIGGIGKKKSNGGTQFYEQDRVYDNKVATAIPTSFQPYYLTNRERESDTMSLRIRKLTPKEILFYLMGLCGIIESARSKNNEKRIREILLILWKEIGKKEIQWEIRRFWSIPAQKILQCGLYEQSILESWFNKSNGQSGTYYIKENSKEIIELSKCLCDMWENWKNRYTPHRWELSKQQFEQFNAFMSQLPQFDTQEKESLCDLWETSKGFGVLQQALCEIQEIWQSTIPQEQSKGRLRIRKLVPCETLKLMGFERKDEQAMRNVGMSDMAIFHCSGDSIITTCLMALFGQMLPMSEQELHQKINDYVERLVKE